MAEEPLGKLVSWNSPPHCPLTLEYKDTADTSQDNPGLLVRPHDPGTQHRAQSSLGLAPGEQEEPNQPPRSCTWSTHPRAPSTIPKEPKQPVFVLLMGRL